MISRTWRERVGEYLELYSGLYHRPATKCSSRGVLKEFGEWWATCARQAPVVEKVTRDDVTAYLRYKIDQGRAPATANKHVRTLRAFMRWCVDRDVIAKDPTHGVRPLKIVRRRHPIPEKADVMALLFFLKCHRDPLYPDLIKLVANTGLRVGEFVFLRTQDVDLKAGTLTVRNDNEHRTKDNEERLIPLNPSARAVVRRWLEIREKKGGELLFYGDRAPADLKSISHAMKRRTTAAGVPHVTFYSLRHLFATTAASRMMPSELAALMGHSDPRTTAKWYVHGFAMKLRVPRVI
jgi:integrase